MNSSELSPRVGELCVDKIPKTEPVFVSRARDLFRISLFFIYFLSETTTTKPNTRNLPRKRALCAARRKGDDETKDAHRDLVIPSCGGCDGPVITKTLGTKQF